MKKNLPNKSAQDESRRTNVLLEEMRSHFKLLAEGQQGILARMDRTDGRINMLDRKIDTLDRKIEELRRDVTMVLKEHEARLRALETAKA